MKTYQIAFRVRFIGEREPETIIELVDIESDSTLHEEEAQIKDFYRTLIRDHKRKSEIAEVYPTDYRILNKNYQIVK